MDYVVVRVDRAPADGARLAFIDSIDGRYTIICGLEADGVYVLLRTVEREWDEHDAKLHLWANGAKHGVEDLRGRVTGAIADGPKAITLSP